MRILQSASKRIGLRVRREPISGGAGTGALFPNPIHLTLQNFGREISPVGDGFPNGGILRGNPAGSAGFWISGTEAGNGLLPLVTAWLFLWRRKRIFPKCRLDNHTLQSGKEKRISFGERQQRGRMGKLLYFLFQTESCIWKSSKEKNLWDA